MKDITLVHHKHDAKKAGLHYDWRIIVDGQAPSWATKKETPAPGEDGEQEVEESGYENTPDNTQARDPQAHGDIRDWGRKGTANASTHYTPAKSGDNPMNEQRMFDDYKNFKAGK